LKACRRRWICESSTPAIIPASNESRMIQISDVRASAKTKLTLA